MITVDKIKENIKCPQFGDLHYGKWGSQKLEIREALKFMCDLYDSMDSIIKQQQERIDKAIKYNNYFENAVKEELDLKQDYSIIIASYIGAFHDTLEEILKGEDKE